MQVSCDNVLEYWYSRGLSENYIITKYRRGCGWNPYGLQDLYHQHSISFPMHAGEMIESGVSI